MKRNAPLVLSSLALFFSLCGAGLAAGHYLITSTSQIKPSVRNALRGAAGPAGPTGAAGAAGTVDWAHAYYRVGGQSTYGAAGQALTASQPNANLIQSCNIGDRAITGGFDGENEIVTTSEPVSAFPWEWRIVGHLDPNRPIDPQTKQPEDGYLEGWVLCSAASPPN